MKVVKFTHFCKPELSYVVDIYIGHETMHEIAANTGSYNDACYVFVREPHYKFHRLRSSIIALFISTVHIHILGVPMGLFLSMEFFGAWQEVATRHTTPYLRTKLWTFL